MRLRVHICVRVKVCDSISKLVWQRLASRLSSFIDRLVNLDMNIHEQLCRITFYYYTFKHKQRYVKEI